MNSLPQRIMPRQGTPGLNNDLQQNIKLQWTHGLGPDGG